MALNLEKDCEYEIERRIEGMVHTILCLKNNLIFRFMWKKFLNVYWNNAQQNLELIIRRLEL